MCAAFRHRSVRSSGRPHRSLSLTGMGSGVPTTNERLPTAGQPGHQSIACKRLAVTSTASYKFIYVSKHIYSQHISCEIQMMQHFRSAK